MRVAYKNLFIDLFALTIMIKSMDGIPLFGSIPSYITYIFTFLCLIVFIGKTGLKFAFFRTSSFKIIIILTLYFVLWGTIFVSDGADRGDINHELFRKIMMMAFVFVSVYGIWKYRCINEILHRTYIYLVPLMLIVFILHIQDINLSSTISLFWNSYAADRYRTMFGYSSSNVVAEVAMTVILLSLLEINRYKNTIKTFLILLIDSVMLIVIVASNSRGTFLATIIMIFAYVFLKLNKKRELKKIVKSWLPVLTFIIVGAIWYYRSQGGNLETFLLMINRNHLLDNLDIVLNTNNKWLGLGNISGGFFSGKNYIYGYQTNYMEMFYAGVFVRSGYLGVFIIISLLIYIFRAIVHSSRANNDFISRWMILVYCYMLFISIFEQYMFSNGYASSMLFLISILSFTALSAKSMNNVLSIKDANQIT